MDWADTTIYLGVIMQSNLEYDQHIALKKNKASKTLGAIKHILKQGHKKAGYCCPILEYADNISQGN